MCFVGDASVWRQNNIEYKILLSRLCVGSTTRPHAQHTFAQKAGSHNIGYERWIYSEYINFNWEIWNHLMCVWNGERINFNSPMNAFDNFIESICWIRNIKMKQFGSALERDRSGETDQKRNNFNLYWVENWHVIVSTITLYCETTHCPIYSSLHFPLSLTHEQFHLGIQYKLIESMCDTIDTTNRPTNRHSTQCPKTFPENVSMQIKSKHWCGLCSMAVVCNMQNARDGMSNSGEWRVACGFWCVTGQHAICNFKSWMLIIVDIRLYILCSGDSQLAYADLWMWWGSVYHLYHDGYILLDQSMTRM